MKYCNVYNGPPNEKYYPDFNSDFDIVVFDEFFGGQPITHINSLCDPAPLNLPCKGGNYLKRKHVPVLILSNSPFDVIYRKALESRPSMIDTLNRRFLVIELTCDDGLMDLCRCLDTCDEDDSVSGDEDNQNE